MVVSIVAKIKHLDPTCRNLAQWVKGLVICLILFVMNLRGIKMVLNWTNLAIKKDTFWSIIVQCGSFQKEKKKVQTVLYIVSKIIIYEL